ncbi:alpha-hydroxy acid oxidase [Pseudoalteromonas tunicata]|uniref:FMN-dependent alpha-hydroxy acid dehydrogenase n=1 Tax=Pseudoalteromonas tunicata D2 TaxID=87626 RepID=A4CE02_9GAMM|nr:alpha-hydroxy acid oxidase [Pseudoalteromonas tunicata]ATC96313.1 glycolate oxidase [Pseudoalteromonas tunicata]AXT31819.1 alpha-hydroxy-acid oxidizing protein [Pseudoalteromonas tunicata]EAR27194.1 FMN-dependent alpha-hydroxy acid dehydrogenase [Pseudoalteromonas tunicata D2]MDP4984576.1 alpha-hydroxy-acid oxidizing protein [Pseudoalteromonas tunicata]
MSALTTIPADIACLADYRRYAEQLLPSPAWHYIDGASADELTKQANESAFARWQLIPRVLSGVTNINTQVNLLGQMHQFPMLLAPVAYQKLAHPSGEVGSMQGAAAQDIGYILSTLASTALEEVIDYKQSADCWFQLYVQPDWHDTLALIQRAEYAGYSALVITVDAPINGLRNREQRAGFVLPAGVSAVNITATQSPQGLQACLNAAPTWQTIKQIMASTHLPVILKGIIAVEDAMLAKELGVAGIVVSNHGGRVLDTMPASVMMLSLIRQAVGNDFLILCDSGIRRGSDIFKALALGADAVLIGRPIMYALATAGPLGVAHMLRILKDELQLTMALCGCASIADISTKHLITLQT